MDKKFLTALITKFCVYHYIIYCIHTVGKCLISFFTHHSHKYLRTTNSNGLLLVYTDGIKIFFTDKTIYYFGSYNLLFEYDIRRIYTMK